MTYGEAHRAELDSIELICGNFVKTKKINNIPTPLPRNKAGRYYNLKLFNYWVQMIKKGSLKQRQMLVSALMFGDTNKYKEIIHGEFKNECV